ncbi:hypothetical protein ACROYT_G014748 [Oculina patagonica]
MDLIDIGTSDFSSVLLEKSTKSILKMLAFQKNVRCFVVNEAHLVDDCRSQESQIEDISQVDKDATYKTTKYAIPLFFLFVHTNFEYKVVAEFLCQNEDKECISKAPNIIKGWNPTWKPKYFMMDYSMGEINAIENKFPDVAVYICDFHHEQAIADTTYLLPTYQVFCEKLT